MVQIIKVAKNLRISIPRDIAAHLGIQPLDYLVVRVKEDERLLILERVEVE